MGYPRTSSAPDAVIELERQVERGSMFTQAVFQKSFSRLSAVEATVRELVEQLVESGVVADTRPHGSVATEETKEEQEEQEDQQDPRDSETSSLLRWPAIAIRVDPDEPNVPEPVDCEARLPICKAVCCRLKFALSQEDVEKGQVKWDIGHPYVIRHNGSGYCCHNDPVARTCSVYEDRPTLCRSYSCRHDKRIWSDFEAMVLNQDWIDEHLAKGDAILLVDAEPDEEPVPVPVAITSRRP